MEKSQFDRYIDGVVRICELKDKKTEFGARISAKSRDDLTTIVKMPFQKMSKRIEDVEFAKSESFELTEKIKIRKIKGIDSSNVCIIEGKMHSIKYLDEDAKNIYLYLQGERNLD